jgi:hypothetical protein
MGRHSAPGDDDAEDRSALAVADLRERYGKQSGARKPGAEPAGSAPKPRRPQRPETAPTSAPPGEDEPQNEGIGLLEDVLTEPVTGPVSRVVPEDVTQQIPAIVEPVRHDAPDHAVTEQIPAIAAPKPGPGTAESEEFSSDSPAKGRAADAADPAQPTKAARPGKGGHATSADAALVRHHSDVRARCAAGVVVPFVLYAVVLVAIGSFRFSTFLLWIWIPLVTAGLLVGQFLDAGHRRYDVGEPPTESPDRP